MRKTEMKKIFLVTAIAGMLLLSTGCSKSDTVVNIDVVSINSGTVAPNIAIGKELSVLEFTDQHEQKHILNNATKKVIFAFKKDMGHIVKELLSSKPQNYLGSKNSYFVADVSKMPSLIFKYAALPDLKESLYPVLLLTDEAVAAGFINEKEIERIMVVTLHNKIVENVTFVATAADLLKEID